MSPTAPQTSFADFKTPGLLDILGRGSTMADAFLRAGLYCSENGVGESWHEVEAKVLAELRRRRVIEVRFFGRRSLDGLIRLANGFKRTVNRAVIKSDDVAKIAGELAVRCNRH